MLIFLPQRSAFKRHWGNPLHKILTIVCSNNDCSYFIFRCIRFQLSCVPTTPVTVFNSFNFSVILGKLWSVSCRAPPQQTKNKPMVRDRKCSWVHWSSTSWHRRVLLVVFPHCNMKAGLKREWWRRQLNTCTNLYSQITSQKLTVNGQKHCRV